MTRNEVEELIKELSIVVSKKLADKARACGLNYGAQNSAQQMIQHHGMKLLDQHHVEGKD